ncbi:4-(cytidine 5'-diphospho)-2-C-methyl-D-erythritol kinase [uncultured Helicobacter sp.]|uniref:4-(cytidine 5'-diphospho)-2-C-methyl-D-erythritol kinase n=1 Tax=uncultured Helicobacter sp. TaxID=175537 RepID=UPI0037523DD9
MQPLILKSYPKLNIFLKIIGRREDGFHLLSSRFVLAKGALFDTLSIESSPSGFALEGDFGCEIESNTIYKAKCALQELATDKRCGRVDPQIADFVQSLKVSVQKRIPEGAGLGGGSANAASFVHSVCALCEIELNAEDYAFIARRCGADVAFFLQRVPSANVSGVGEEVIPFVEDLPEFEIFTPQIVCPTPAVYGAYRESHATCKRVFSPLPREWLTIPSAQILATHALEELNDLYASALFVAPELESLRTELGRGWFFSGSGSSFFRIKE